MDILLGPVYALFSLDFYRRVQRSSLSLGFLYLLYLSAILSILFFWLFFIYAVPQADRFVEWVKAKMPVLTWAEEGLRMDRPSPYVMEHPEFGPLVVFDTTKDDIDLEELKKVPVFVSSRKVYAHQQGGEVRIYDLKELMRQVDPKTGVKIDAAMIDAFYHSIKGPLIFFLFLFFFPSIFIWKLLAGLLYSLLGCVINLFRGKRLSYGAVLNVTFFALTPVSFIEVLQLALPSLGRVPFGIIGSAVVTGIYLFLAVKKTEDDREDFSPPSSEADLPAPA